MRVLGILLLIAGQAFGYSVLTHEQLIDQSWKPAIVPILLARYPALSAAQLDRAHAFAYGGCVIQDAGYYPFSHEFFSDLTHYVRSGDFVESLFRNARDANELAFAIGALAHYAGDAIGHPEATNRAVAIEFPGLAKKLAETSISYAQNKTAHGRVEFAFDINAVTKGRLAPSAYLKRIGLAVPRRLLQAAFYETYGLDVWKVLGKYHSALGIYRFGARTFLPSLAYAEAVLHRDAFPPDAASHELDVYEAGMKQMAVDADWDRYRKRPGIRIHLLAGAIWVLPKVGMLKMLAIRGPNAETEAMYIHSVNLSTDYLNTTLRRYAARGRLEETGTLRNRDLDTGDRVKRGAYPLTDATYAALVFRLVNTREVKIPAGLKADILSFYGDAADKNLQALEALETRPEPVQ